jgi:hypothetical protein
LSAWGSSFGDAWGASFGGASSGVTINCNKGTATASGRQATITTGGSTTISCNVGAATASGLPASISTGSSADVKVSWLQFDSNATPCDVKVSWVRFDTNSTPCDVRVSWVQFDTSHGSIITDDPIIYPGAFAPLSRASSPISIPFKRRSRRHREQEMMIL